MMILEKLEVEMFGLSDHWMLWKSIFLRLN